MKYQIMLGILFDLLSKRQVSAKYLSDKYEVNIRSIYRYINSLEDAGVPLYTIRGNGGGIAIVDTYKLSSTFMTIEEFNETINALTAICEGVPNKILESAINKLKASIKNEYNNLHIKSGNLIIDGSSWGDTVGYKNKLFLIQKALENNYSLLIKYHDRNGEITEREINPHIVVFKQGLWYVYAYCNLRNEFRFFKTGRIESATITNKHFTRQEIDTNKLSFEFWENTNKTDDVVLEIDKKCLSDVEEWLGIENIKTENAKNVARVKLPIDNGLVSKIMSFGNGIKVLEPLNLKEKVIKTAEEIINN